MLSPAKKNGSSEGDLYFYLRCLCLAIQGTFCIWVTETLGIDFTGLSMLVTLLLATSGLQVAMQKTPKGKNVSWVSRRWFAISSKHILLSRNTSLANIKTSSGFTFGRTFRKGFASEEPIIILIHVRNPLAKAWGCAFENVNYRTQTLGLFCHF